MADLEVGTKKLFDKTKQTMQNQRGKYLDLSEYDVAAVKDIRRALRRKYASRSNLPKIFSQWDKGGKGTINMEDLINGITRAGITLSHE